MGREVSAADNIVLVGPMGAGKSSIARELARIARRRWVDTDRMVIREAGMPIAEIFATHGEAHFREMESAALASLANERGLIVATGGGIVCEPRNRTLLHALGCVAWLTADEEVLFERVSRNGRRPLLQTADPRATLHDLLERRRPLYESCAHFSVDGSSSAHAEVAEKVLAEARAFLAARDGTACPPVRSGVDPSASK